MPGTSTLISKQHDPVANHATAAPFAARRVTQLYDAVLAPTSLRITQYALLANAERMGARDWSELNSYTELSRVHAEYALRWSFRAI